MNTRIEFLKARVAVFMLAAAFAVLDCKCHSEQSTSIPYCVGLTAVLEISNDNPLVGETVLLDGSQSEAYVSRTWQLDRPPGSSATIVPGSGLHASVIPDVEGIYQVTLSLTTPSGSDKPQLCGKAAVSFNAASNPPVADAGPDQEADIGDRVQLDGSASYDPDNRDLLYSWDVIDAPSGASSSLILPKTISPTFVPHEPGAFEVRLRVHILNDDINDDRDTVRVVINPPEVHAFAPDTGPVGTAVTITGKNYSSHLPAGNIVRFHGTTATIISASDTQLVAEVPAGATTGPISVTIQRSGRIGESAQDFVVSGTGGPWTQVFSTGQDLYGLTFVDIHTGIAVGEGGTAYRTTDGGSTWSSLTTGSGETLRDVSFTHAGIGYAVGINGTILQTTDYGSTWVSLSSPAENVLLGVSTADDTTAYVVGQAGGAWRTTDTGTNWVYVGLGGRGNSDIWFTGKYTGFAVAMWGLKGTVDGGENWTTRYSTEEHLLAVSFADSLNGTAVGTAGHIVNTIDGGTNWSPQSSGIRQNLQGVSFVSGNADYGIAVGEGGIIVRTTDGGINWTQEDIGITDNFYAVYTLDANAAVAAGGSGAIFLRH